MDLPRNRFKARLAENGVQYGLWVTIPDPSVVEALAGAGYDWIVLDSEHTPVEPSGMLPLLQAAAPNTTSADSARIAAISRFEIILSSVMPQRAGRRRALT